MDTELPEYQAWQEIYQIYGVELPIEKWALVIGTRASEFDVVAELQQKTGLPLDRQQLNQDHQQRVKLKNGTTLPLPGVCELIIEASRAGLKLAIASSSPRYWIEEHLRRVGLLAYFPVICSADDVIHVKPDPALYCLAISKLGLTQQETVAFEDSYNGLKAANAAGIFCVVVPNSLTMQMDFQMADLIIPSLEKINLTGLNLIYKKSKTTYPLN